MYARKQDGRLSAIRQATDALLRAMAERFPDLGDHTAERRRSRGDARPGVLGMNREEVEEVRRAAELHDIGKVAIPETILDKPGPLEPQEWAHIRRHTVIGERIVGAAPALGRVAKLVRSTHERHDGGGYPDGLAGEQIPLGARIVAVCDAFDAMTRDRSYRVGDRPRARPRRARALRRRPVRPGRRRPRSCGRGGTPGRASRARRSLPPRPPSGGRAGLEVRSRP